MLPTGAQPGAVECPVALLPSPSDDPLDDLAPDVPPEVDMMDEIDMDALPTPPTDHPTSLDEYDPSNPVPSHFTQVVWKASTQVGCAEAQCSGIFAASFGLAKYFVCEYSPQGNVIGEFA